METNSTTSSNTIHSEDLLDVKTDEDTLMESVVTMGVKEEKFPANLMVRRKNLGKEVHSVSLSVDKPKRYQALTVKKVIVHLPF